MGNDPTLRTQKQRVWIALTRGQILGVAAAASNATRYLEGAHFSDISWWGWFWIITGVYVVVGALVFPPKVKSYQRRLPEVVHV